MSKISIVVNESALNNITILQLKNYTQQSISQINKHLANETPIFTTILFHNNHVEVTKILLKILDLFREQNVKFTLYELEENETFEKKLNLLNEISIKTLENILTPDNQYE